MSQAAYEYKASKTRSVGRLSSPSMARTLQFALQSIRLRLGRCVITAASVVGAIAFLTYNALGMAGLKGSFEKVFWPGYTPAAQTAQAPADPAPQAAGQAASQEDADFFARLEQFTAEKSAQQKQQFVLVLSLLVCFVGISNSMMMSIKERYREIATLKCLGAVNSYIRRLFMLESLLQAGAGCIVGLLLGSTLFVIVQRYAVVQSAFSWDARSMAWMLAVWAACFLLGIAMTVVASIWPIRKALAMAPVEALRVEE